MANHRLTGNCRCGNVNLEVNLASEPATYSPRACDCSFCRRHHAAYLSDPKGSVTLRTEAGSNLRIEQQGDELAEFLLCSTCSDLLGVRWQEGRHQYGSVNSTTLFERALLGQEVSVSPKQLSAGQKTERWKKLWFPTFVVITTNA